MGQTAKSITCRQHVVQVWFVFIIVTLESSIVIRAIAFSLLTAVNCFIAVSHSEN